MTDLTLNNFAQWRDAFVSELQRRDVSNLGIGDALLEVAAHVSESGETPQAAFGDPKSYARDRAANAPRRETTNTEWSLKDFVVQMVIPFAGAYLMASNALNLGRHGSSFWTVVGILVGLVITVGTFALVRMETIIDPLTTKPILDTRQRTRTMMIGFFLIAAMGLYVVGRLTAA